MIRATDCFFDDQTISVDLALFIRQQWEALGGHLPRPAFKCVECLDDVWPHRQGGKIPAHFEHRGHSHTDCSRRHLGRRATQSSNAQVNFEADDIRAIEGYLRDSRLLSRGRNRVLAQQRDETDRHACAACGFKTEVNGRHIVECHHLRPLSFDGVREVSLSDLITLCPTCHRIAHTRLEPLTIAEIQRALPLKSND